MLDKRQQGVSHPPPRTRGDSRALRSRRLIAARRVWL
jgi:hypothetical protein